jgi:hypothetical protein
MSTDIREDSDWKTLLGFVPGELTSLALSTGAMRRLREVRSGEDLLRLSLVYSDDEMSLRTTSAWARARGIADLSDVALLKRLRQSGPFLKAILSHLLPRVWASGSASSLRIVALDATTISRQRSSGTDFRAHVTYDLSHGGICGVELTDVTQGERLTRAVAGPGDVVLADRGYQGRTSLAEFMETGAQVILRIQPFHFPLELPDGTRINPVQQAESLQVAEVLDMAVQTIATKDAPAVPGRLIMVRKSAEQADKDKHRLAKRAREDNREIGEKALLASSFVCVFTTLEQAQADGDSILDIYRFRWQIEMLFKRAKGIVSLGELVARDLALCETLILAKLLILLLIQKYEQVFFPWGYPLRRPEPLPNPSRPV